LQLTTDILFNFFSFFLCLVYGKSLQIVLVVVLWSVASISILTAVVRMMTLALAVWQSVGCCPFLVAVLSSIPPLFPNPQPTVVVGTRYAATDATATASIAAGPLHLPRRLLESATSALTSGFSGGADANDIAMLAATRVLISMYAATSASVSLGVLDKLG